LIEKSQITIYKCGNIPIKSVLNKYSNDELEEIRLAGPEHNGIGH